MKMATVYQIVTSKPNGQAVVNGIFDSMAQASVLRRIKQTTLCSARLWLLSELGFDAVEEVRMMEDSDVLELWRSR